MKHVAEEVLVFDPEGVGLHVGLHFGELSIDLKVVEEEDGDE